MLHRISKFLAVVLLLNRIASAGAPVENPYAKWEPEIKAFETADRSNPPPKQAILFVGSSSIRLWKTLSQDFEGYPVINRGFGGSQMDDSTYFADRIVTRYQPKQIFVYAGDNDIASGKTPKQVAANFKDFVSKVRQSLPNVRICYISIKPSPSRWHLADQVRTANHLIAEDVQANQNLCYIDVFTPMLGSDGKPQEDLFVNDKLHMNKKGYDLWTRLIRPHFVQ